MRVEGRNIIFKWNMMRYFGTDEWRVAGTDLKSVCIFDGAAWGFGFENNFLYISK
jgi:hypothetical protein